MPSLPPDWDQDDAAMVGLDLDLPTDAWKSYRHTTASGTVVSADHVHPSIFRMELWEGGIFSTLTGMCLWQRHIGQPTSVWAASVV